MGFFKRLFSRSNDKLSENGHSDFKELQNTFGYYFNDPTLLELSLTHRSYCFGTGKTRNSNERLEFLGDSVLGLVIAEFLYRDHPHLREGELTKTKALLVNETTLATRGREIGLNRFIRLSPEEDRSGGRQRPSIISDAFEAALGAIYLDGGIDAARDVIFRLIYTSKKSILADESQRNFKGELLELVQGRGDGIPHYVIASEHGPDHRKIFKVDVMIAGQQYGRGEGFSKKEAEQKAAAQALSKQQSNSG